MRKAPLYLGADPGKHGAVVLISKNLKDVIQIPTTVSNGCVDVGHLYNEILPYNDRIVAASMEHVHALFGASAAATFDFGDANGCLRAILTLLSDSSKKYPLILVQPKLWQKVAWSGIQKIENPMLDAYGRTKLLKTGQPRMKVDTKATSMLAAHKLFPSVSFIPKRCRIEHDGCIDAALIAYYGLVKSNA